MITLSFLFVTLSISSSCVSVGHHINGTNYGKEAIDRYAQARHGIDGALFLDPYFLPCIKDVAHAKLLDAGCGAAPWAIVAAKNDAQVFALDIQEGMIASAKKFALEDGVSERIHFTVGSVAQLPYPDNFFDRAISINVGCNLPQDVFKAHFEELFRTLQSGGKAVITAPTSCDTVFALNKNISETKNEIEAVLSSIDSLEDGCIREKLNQLTSVLRATFVIRNGKLLLVTDEKMLIEGEAVWRKIPGVVVPNFYHNEKQYIQELLNAGFEIDCINRPQFKDREEWKQAGSGLAKEYIYYPAFVIFHTTKP